MASFLPAMAIVWMHEVDARNPHKVTIDSGGVTKYGISCNWARSIVPDCTEEFVRDLTPEAAKELYRKHFWEPYVWDKIADQTVANKLFDMAVNMGPQQAIRLGQLAVGDCGQRVRVDGVLGPETITGINFCDAVTLVDRLIDRQAAYYRGLATSNPGKFAKYLDGWLSRAGWPNNTCHKE